MLAETSSIRNVLTGALLASSAAGRTSLTMVASMTVGEKETKSPCARGARARGSATRSSRSQGQRAGRTGWRRRAVRVGTTRLRPSALAASDGREQPDAAERPDVLLSLLEQDDRVLQDRVAHDPDRQPLVLRLDEHLQVDEVPGVPAGTRVFAHAGPKAVALEQVDRNFRQVL